MSGCTRLSNLVVTAAKNSDNESNSMFVLLQHTAICACFGDKLLSLKSLINVRSSCNSEQLTKYSDTHTQKLKTKTKTLFAAEASLGFHFLTSLKLSNKTVTLKGGRGTVFS